MEFHRYPHVIPTLFNVYGFGPPRDLLASTCTWIGHPVSVYSIQLFALLRLAFASAPMLQHLNLAAYHNSLARSTKSTWSLALPLLVSIRVSGSISLPSRGPFHLSLTVLFAIGHWVVFRLGGWALRLHTGFHVSGTTLVPPGSSPISSTGVSPSSLGCSKTIRLSSLNSTWWSATPKNKSFGLASFPFASPLLRKSIFLSLPGAT